MTIALLIGLSVMLVLTCIGIAFIKGFKNLD